MTKTKDRNGVLIFLAVRDKQVAIIGDRGIHEKVPEGFWDSEIAPMRGVSGEEICGRVVRAILKAGEKLKAFYPYHDEDQNELADDISVSDWS